MSKNAYIKGTRKTSEPLGVIDSERHLELMDAFLGTLEERKYSPASVRKRRECIRNLLAWFRDENIERVRDVDLEVLENYHKSLIKRGYSDHSICSFLISARQFFSFLAGEGVIFSSPGENWTICKPERRLGTVLTEDEVKKLLAACDISTAAGLRNRAMLEVLYSCGLRRGELLGMTVQDASFYENSIRVRGKGGKERVIPVGKHAEKYTSGYIRNARPELLGDSTADALWISIRHKVLSGQALLTVIRKTSEKAGMEKRVNTHTLRRTCATHLLRNGAHPLMISQLLGHSDLKTLSHYLKTSITDLKKTHKKTSPGK
jgi:integrase/recombinase XerD